MKAAPPITKGRLTALWVVLSTLQRTGPLPQERLAIYARNHSSLRGGGLPTADAIFLGLRAQLLSERSGSIAITPGGLEVLRLSTSSEPTHEAYRFMLQRVLLLDPPSWVPFSGPQGKPRALEPELLRMLEPPPSDEEPHGSIKWFWLALEHDPTHSSLRSKTGLLAEEATLRFEWARLRNEGFPHLAKRVEHVAVISDAFGFDVWSFAGRSYGQQPEQRMCIEVKGMSIPATDHFTLYLTAHEWEVAKALGGSHRFYLWDGVCGRTANLAQGPKAVVCVSDLAPHLPRPGVCEDSSCSWTVCRVRLPLKS